MTDDREPHIACTKFISENEKEKKLIATEFETPDQWFYAMLLGRLGDPENGFDIPGAGDKLELMAETMISYKRQGRLENVVALTGSNVQQASSIPVGTLPIQNVPMNAAQLPSANAPQEKKKWGIFRGRDKK